MLPSNPLNKNWFHISNGYNFQTKHALFAVVAGVVIKAILIATGA